MKKQEESPPIDELFARKLGHASLSPSPDGFERLQARMNKAQPEQRVVIWRNPALQRYMAIAASLALVCLFGWLYLQSSSTLTKVGEQVANSVGKPPRPEVDKVGSPANKNTMNKKPDGQPAPAETENHLATVGKPVEVIRKEKNSSTNPPSLQSENSNKELLTSKNEQSVLTQIPQYNNKTKLTDTTLPDVKIINSVDTNTERVAENTVKPAAPIERVLTVTIEEPASLLAARQATKRESGTVALTGEEPQKEAKGNLWQQVRRIKQGEVFARHDNPGNEDQGLLGRAYSGLKQSFEKDKSEK
ncbi:hypothetical protein [Spirosoma luteum]|uniref:hypothetical protein n=1 Tax=Spirosoma luteum TaxID=431553 RepID=UPI00035E51FF|nr:hypothetical protein [Spirosoma luteum]